jgi:sialate O-acetylesterase
MPAIRLSFALAALAVLALASGAQAEVTPHALFSDHAVLQQGVSLPIWGTARDGEKVTVQLAGQTATTTTIDGKWRVEFPPLKPGGPHVLTLQGDNTVTINDVLVGEVWLCSGQSNMEFSLGALPLWAKEKPRAELPGLRMFKVTRQIGVEPMANVVGQWSVCAPETAGRFSAVGYFFGRDLHAARGVPVGIINSSKGGTWAQAWVGLKGYESNPGYAKTAERMRAAAADYPKRLAEYPAKKAAYEGELNVWKKTEGPRQEAALSAWKKRSEDAKKANTPFTEPEPAITVPKPKEPDSPEGGPNGYGALFNGMIAPLAPCALTGVAWYQGESNSSPHGVPLYEAILSTLVTDWRREFNRPDLPFLIVQLPGYKSLLPEIREAQLNVSRKLPPAALVVTTDLGDTGDLHPKDKEPVGTRLALAARSLAYGEKIESSGPLFSSLKTGGGRAVVSFTHTGGGLVAQGGALKGFTLAGPDMVFVAATAVISGDTVLVSSPDIRAPVAVRYGWSTIPDGNLSNSAGLPASPFRSDK